jgi:hypothetical protein
MTKAPEHDHAWSKVEGVKRGDFQEYRCEICGTQWPSNPEPTPNGTR